MKKNSSFETALKQLEKIVLDMEGGQLPLETALKKFEEGVALSRHCTRKLEEVQKKVTILLSDENDAPYSAPFGDEEVE